MADIRSFFGGGGGGKAPSKAPTPLQDKVASSPAQAKTSSPAPEAGPKRARRIVVEDEDEDDAQAGVANAVPEAEQPAAKAARVEANSDAAAAGVSHLTSTPTPSPVPGASKAARGAGSGEDVDAAAEKKDAGEEKEEEEEAERTPSPLVAKLRQPEEKVRSKTTLENMKVVHDNARTFDPDQYGTWKAGAPVPYAVLVSAFDKCGETTKRIQITSLMTNLFRAVVERTPEDLLPCLYLSLNRLAPAYEGVELGLGDALLIKAVAESCGRQEKVIKEELEAEGDLGAIAVTSRATQRLMFTPARLAVRKVLATMKEIAKVSGDKAQAKKRDKLKQLLVAAQGTESQYIIRSAQGKLRIGLAEQTVLTALAHALALSPPADTGGVTPNLKKGAEALHEALQAAEVVVKDVYSQLPSYDRIVGEMLKRPLAQLPEHVGLTAGIPVTPMLAKPTKGVQEVLDRFSKGTFTCEYKYDGERAQIHKTPAGDFKIFSRSSEDMTGKYPDVIAQLPQAVLESTQSFIIDCEAVGYDEETGKLKTFQDLSKRAKKNVTLDNIKVKCKVFAFDLLYLNGESLIKRPLGERRAKLRTAFAPTDGIFDFATSMDSDNAEDIQTFIDDAVAGQCEGIMVKTLEVDATYEPSRRSFNWLKVKKDYIKGMTDSLDLVPIGAYHGKGKRTGVFGAYLLACWDEEREEFQSVCKIGTGFSEEVLQSHADFFREEGADRIISQPRSYYVYPDNHNLVPDVWFNACTVWEVLCADLSISPQHMAARGEVHDTKGIALRFPRFIRTRDDKSAEDATKASQVAQMYRDQFTYGDKNNNKQRTAAGDDDDDEEDEVYDMDEE